MKLYIATRTPDRVTLTVETPLSKREITPRESLELRNHSPTGFEMGYAGSGPAQLALAILLDACGPSLALRWYQDFKADFLVGTTGGGIRLSEFRITDEEILKWISTRNSPLPPMTANEYLEHAQIVVEAETLSDGSQVYNLVIGEHSFPCYSEKHAREAAHAIAVALRNATNETILWG